MAEKYNGTFGGMMATTHQRIRCILDLVAKREKWTKSSQIVKAIYRNKPKEMKIRGDGTADEHYMSEQAIGKLLRLMTELNLIAVQDDGKISLTAEGVKSANDPEIFDLQIRSYTKTRLQESNASIEDVNTIIKDIQLPLIPDAKTIHEKLRERNPQTINFDGFRQLLYLYASAGGNPKRVVRAFYTTRK